MLKEFFFGYCLIHFSLCTYDTITEKKKNIMPSYLFLHLVLFVINLNKAAFLDIDLTHTEFTGQCCL